ncbi:MAG: dephospho-CoA kinase [Lachnospira sp.]|nr:dephospho-CoA kinase [Lachnospira sp.]
MKVIGITGGVGCGKTTVLRYISDNYNAKVIYADDVAKELMQKDAKAYTRIVEVFGDGILRGDLEIDRAKLSQIVFTNKFKLVVLNSIVHPLVKKHIIEDIARESCEQKYDYVFVEAALLIEDHYDVICDELWYIYADETVRRNRLKESRNYTDEKIDDVISNQLSEDEFRKACQETIDNSYEFEYTKCQIDKLLG